MKRLVAPRTTSESLHISTETTMSPCFECQRGPCTKLAPSAFGDPAAQCQSAGHGWLQYTHRRMRIKICNPSVPSTSKSVPEHRRYPSLSETASPSTPPEIQQHAHSNDCLFCLRPRQNMSRPMPSSLLNSQYFKTRIIQIGAQTPEL